MTTNKYLNHLSDKFNFYIFDNDENSWWSRELYMTREEVDKALADLNREYNSLDKFILFRKESNGLSCYLDLTNPSKYGIITSKV